MESLSPKNSEKALITSKDDLKLTKSVTESDVVEGSEKSKLLASKSTPMSTPSIQINEARKSHSVKENLTGDKNRNKEKIVDKNPKNVEEAKDKFVIENVINGNRNLDANEKQVNKGDEKELIKNKPEIAKMESLSVKKNDKNCQEENKIEDSNKLGENKMDLEANPVKKTLSFKESEEDLGGSVEFRKSRYKIQESKSDNDRFTTRSSYMIKTKGNLFYKKKGPFSKWKVFYIVLDDYKLQMNFFKSHEDYEKLARCKQSIDLRFVNELKPHKPHLLQSNYPFKMYRRAGLSTVRLAAHTEEERAKWITTLDEIVMKIKSSPERDFLSNEFQRASTLPGRVKTADDLSTESESGTASSAPDQENVIKPKKVSTSGFKLNTSQISSVKLKRVNSGGKEPAKKIKEGDENECDREEKFGVSLRKVQTEKTPPRDTREQSPEYVEFKEKHKSLSLSRKGKSPKLPLKENSTCSHLVGNMNLEDHQNQDRIKSSIKETRDSNKKRSPSPNIPISKTVETVMKNKEKGGNSSTAGELKSTGKNISPAVSICHATSSEIEIYESVILEVDEQVKNEDQVFSRQLVFNTTQVASKPEEVAEETNATCVVSETFILKASQTVPKILLNDSNDELLTDKSEQTRRNLIGNNLPQNENENLEHISTGTTIPIQLDQTTQDEVPALKDGDIIIATGKEQMKTVKEERNYTEIISAEEKDYAKEKARAKETVESEKKSNKEEKVHSKAKVEEVKVHNEEKVNSEEKTQDEEKAPSKNLVHEGKIFDKENIDAIKTAVVIPKIEVLTDDKGFKVGSDTDTNITGNETQSRKAVGVSEVENKSFPIKAESLGVKIEESDIKLSQSKIISINETSSTKDGNDRKQSMQKFDGIISQDQIDLILLGKGQTQSDEFSKNNTLSLNMQTHPALRESSSTFSGKEEVRVSGHSFMSQVSTESDEPLPRLNFLGKGDRSSSGSNVARDSGNFEEHKIEKSSDSDESGEHSAQIRESSSKSKNTNLSPESSSIVGTRSSLVSPEFTVVEERADEIGDDVSTKLILKEQQVEADSGKQMEADFSVPLCLDNTSEKHTQNKSPSGKEKLNTGVSTAEIDKKSSSRTVEKVAELNSEVIPIQSVIGETKKTFNMQMSVIEKDNSNNLLTESVLGEDNSSNELKQVSDVITNQAITAIINNETHESVPEQINLILEEDPNSMIFPNKEVTEDGDKQILMAKSEEILDKKLEDEHKNVNKETKISDEIKKTTENVKPVGHIECDEEVEDYFPVYGGKGVKYRLKEEHLKMTEDSMRTSGIADLKEFLKNNEDKNDPPEIKSGISRLGHSPAFEKLRKEVP